MEHMVALADESGTNAESPCYTIGGFIVPASEEFLLASELQAIRDKHGVAGEIKWSKIDSYRARRAVALEGLRHLFQAGARFSAIVTEKATFQKWQNDHEAGFYHSYFEFARHLAREGNDVTLRIDERSDHYDKQTEVIEVITNHSLVREAVSSRLRSVEMVQSKEQEILQFSDLLVGAVNADTGRFLKPSLTMNVGKQILLREVADMLGWTNLQGDTYPNHLLNIWHFPMEFRARPSTVRVNVGALTRLQLGA